MDAAALGVVLAFLGLALVLVIPGALVPVARRRTLGRLGWTVTALAFVVVLAAVWLWLSPVVVDGRYCFQGSPAVDGLIPDRTLTGDAALALPLERRLACSAAAQRIVLAWGAAALLALVAWAWVVRRRPARRS